MNMIESACDMHHFTRIDFFHWYFAHQPFNVTALFKVHADLVTQVYFLNKKFSQAKSFVNTFLIFQWHDRPPFQQPCTHWGYSVIQNFQKTLVAISSISQQFEVPD